MRVRAKLRQRKRTMGPVRLRRLLQSPDPAVRCKAVDECIGENISREAMLLLRRAALRDTDRWVRERAAYVLSFSTDQKWVKKPLFALYTRAGEHPRVRAQAAEGLAYHFGMTRSQKPLVGRVVDTLMSGLRDNDVRVRFWSVFALWSIDYRARRALPELERLAESDHELCPGWWTVAEEAQDAVAYFHGTYEGNDRMTNNATLTADDLPPYG